VVSLVLLLVSCAGYTHYDKGFKLEAYGWLLVWYFFCIFETCYVKHICDTVTMTSWGRVYYTNILSAAALAAVFPLSGEKAALMSHAFSPPQVLLLVLSCAVGVCMSHASYLLRANVSATACVLVG
jgi:GDP-mannose transporter